ncbi:hypothetical protein EP331_00020 [bacterium]|nr:MAG: hypothetical protein EP331_00020 [bacterium]
MKLDQTESNGLFKARISGRIKEGSSDIAYALQSSSSSKELALEKLYVISLINLEEARLIVQSVEKELKK